jgi:hypothetical protein
VISTPAQGTGPSLAGPPRPLRVFAATRALIALLLGGLATVANYRIRPVSGMGFRGDINTFGAWPVGMGRYGAVGFYEPIGSDYAPGAAVPFLLLAVASLANLHGILAGRQPLLAALARSPEVIAISAHIVTGGAVWAALRRRSSVRSSPDGFARAAADVALSVAAHP